MEMQYIESRALEQMGYDEANSELHVVFKNGRRCIYSGVPRHIWDGMINAESRGGYLDANVKKPGYRFRYE
ncbi:KTSC domain-containing protein [Aureimonas altamirensis]|uniref:KTSC domain-containing protein n=1 Tax=Aureimonas altamirensis TaxID=370622 RepID=UPI001E659FF6|nr:KTSC domain-containing protein [Aureimonas altamirensis]UHD44532.1 KTSC domain-containing protein [Aureimonas altamirensis]